MHFYEKKDYDKKRKKLTYGMPAQKYTYSNN